MSESPPPGPGGAPGPATGSGEGSGQASDQASDQERTRIRRPAPPPPATGSTRPRPDRARPAHVPPPQWQPPDTPTPSGQEGSTPPDTAPRRSASGAPAPSQRLLYVAVSALVLSIAAAVIAVVFFSGDGGVPVSDLDRGACLTSKQLSGDPRSVDDLAVVKCDTTHQAQVAAVGDLDADQSAQDACVQALVDAGTSVAALSGEGREVRPLATDDQVACLVVGETDQSVLG